MPLKIRLQEALPPEKAIMPYDGSHGDVLDYPADATEQDMQSTYSGFCQACKELREAGWQLYRVVRKREWKVYTKDGKYIEVIYAW